MAVIRRSTAIRNSEAALITAALDAGPGPGTIQIRSGAIPATPQTAATGTLLATITLSDPSGGAPATGSVTITDPASVTGVADGGAFPYWARFLDSTGTAVMDCDVTATGGGGGITHSAQIVTGVTVDMGAITTTAPA